MLRTSATTRRKCAPSLTNARLLLTKRAAQRNTRLGELDLDLTIFFAHPKKTEGREFPQGSIHVALFD